MKLEPEMLQFSEAVCSCEYRAPETELTRVRNLSTRTHSDKDLEGSVCVLLEASSRHSPGGTGETPRKTSVKMAGVPA